LPFAGIGNSMHLRKVRRPGRRPRLHSGHRRIGRVRSSPASLRNGALAWSCRPLGGPAAPTGGGTAGPAPGDRHLAFRKAVGSAKDLNHGEVNRSGSEPGDDDNGSIKHVWERSVSGRPGTPAWRVPHYSGMTLPARPALRADPTPLRPWGLRAGGDTEEDH